MYLRYVFEFLLAVLATIPLCLAQANVCDGFTLSGTNADCGPYTPTFCEECNTCSLSKRSLNSTESEFSEALTVPDPQQLSFTDDELVRYKYLQMDYVVEFAKNPPPNDDPVNLPYCGLGNLSSVSSLNARAISSSLSTNSIVKRGGFFNGGFKFDWPRFSRAPRVPRAVCIPKTISNIPVHFHIFASNSSNSDKVSDDILKNQMRALGEAFEPLGISFAWSGVANRYTGTDDFRRFTQHGFRESLVDGEKEFQNEIFKNFRKGTYSSLNVFVVEYIRKGSCDDPLMPKGYCTLPNKPATLDTDKCVMVMDSMPGVAFRSTTPSRGTTLIHEVGHWLGLGHVFADDIEDTSKPCVGTSDRIADTPLLVGYPRSNLVYPKQEYCCPKRTSSGRVDTPLTYEPCGSLIRVNNYMSYSPTRGSKGPKNINLQYPWTRGQRARMFTNFYTLRRDIVPDGDYVSNKCADQPIYEETSFSPRKLGRRQSIDPANLDVPFGFMESLQVACSFNPTNPDDDLEIDGVTGEIIHIPDNVKYNCTDDLAGLCPAPPEYVMPMQSTSSLGSGLSKTTTYFTASATGSAGRSPQQTTVTSRASQAIEAEMSILFALFGATVMCVLL
ncbi:hypothetical protein V1517DRAFT_109361 [Lipomyces orientalis]|uniref:Uncharacterized protein n=1 Tax=Lipomyces orientalis TaxID=1233043 RepID=A0ACC3TCZ2_9ASCO